MSEPPVDPQRAAALTPAEIVEHLGRHVVGQTKAKRAVAVAIRNRWRRLQLGEELRREVLPHNILLVGPTGVGKTEIARRLADLVGAPFLKVEATRFTEVGYVGRDVETIVRDLVERAIVLLGEAERRRVERRARDRAEERLLDALVAAWKPQDAESDPLGLSPPGGSAVRMQDLGAVRVRLRERLRAGALSQREVEVELHEREASPLEGLFGDPSMAQAGVDLRQMMERLHPPRLVRRRLLVPDALARLTAEEAASLVDESALARDAIRLVEESGIVFLDEIDKIAGATPGAGPNVSREGVQRDLLPLVEGTTVATRHGPVRTDHVLFIAAGAFHLSRPSDLLPELQGRFPLRVRLDSLGEEDFVRILKEPRAALTRQAVALLGTEGIRMEFTEDGVREIARAAVRANALHEDIGARRLMTIMERVLEDISFDAPARQGEHILIDAKRVRQRVEDLLADQDLGRYVL